MAHTLKNDYGLRVLAVTLDYGFMPNEFAQANLKRVIDYLKLDHVYIKVPQEIVSLAFGNFLRKPHNYIPCKVCSYTLAYPLMTKIAVEYSVPKIMWGFDRGQLFSNLFTMPDKWLVDTGLHQNPKTSVADVVRSTEKELIELGLSPEQRKLIVPSHLDLTGTGETPEHVSFFLFHPYDEEKMKRVLIENMGWVRPPDDAVHGHYDCGMKQAVSYAELAIGMGGMLEGELSVDIREGKLSRVFALKRLEKEHKEIVCCEHPFKTIEDVCGISEESFLRKTRRLGRIAPIINGVFRIVAKIHGLFSETANDPLFFLRKRKV